MSFLLDTNALSEIFNKRPNECVTKWFGQTDESSQFISCFSIGEIQKGISKLAPSRRKGELQLWFDRVQSRYSTRILSCTAQTAKIWGQLLARLELEGRPIPVVDSLIAATALEHDLIVVTRNTDDFAAANVKVLNIWE